MIHTQIPKIYEKARAQKPADRSEMERFFEASLNDRVPASLLQDARLFLTCFQVISSCVSVTIGASHKRQARKQRGENGIPHGSRLVKVDGMLHLDITWPCLINKSNVSALRAFCLWIFFKFVNYYYYCV